MLHSTSVYETVASTPAIRSHFPALKRIEAGLPVAYFDGPGGTQVPKVVADAVTDYLLHHNANTHWAYPTSAETDIALAEARHALADYLGAEPADIAFGANMTTLTFHLARALGRRMQPGDEIIVTQLDHQANVAPWKDLEVERGISVKVVPMNPETGKLDLDVFESLFSTRTRLVAVGAASNALGTINPVKNIIRLARENGTLTFVDAVHLAAHHTIDVQDLGCDFLACSAYKFYGPHVGVLYARHELLQDLQVPKLDPAPDEAPERIETGTLNHEGIVGAGAAIDFLASLVPGENRRERLVQVMTALHTRGVGLLDRMWTGLSAIDWVSCYGPPPSAPRTPTLSFTVRGFTSEHVSDWLAKKHGVFVSHGDFYASTVVECLGLEGLVRAGCACYTTEDEVDRLILGVETLVGDA